MELRKKSLAVLAGVAIAGLVGAAAASLGGLNSQSVGADDTVVASCQTTTGVIDVTYTTAYSATAQAYTVTSVSFDDLDLACGGLDYELTLDDSSALTVAPLFNTSGAVPAGGGTLTVSVSPAVSAEALTHVALVIAS